MTYANFKDSVASYSNRIAALFATVGAQDIVLEAMNDARRSAQQKYRFNLAKRQAFVNLSLLPQSLKTDFRTTPGGATAVVINRLDELWEYGTATVASTTCYYPTVQLDIRRQSMLEYAAANRSLTSSTSTLTQDFAYCHGPNVYHSNLTTQTWYLAFVVEFLPDLTSAATTDLFLDYAPNWLKFATLMNLNAWLADSEKIQVDSQLMQLAWDAFTQFDAQQAEVGTISLD
jgi:hypothetical protein